MSDTNGNGNHPPAIGHAQLLALLLYAVALAMILAASAIAIGARLEARGH